MKKLLIAVFMVSLVMLGFGIADAAVQGQCSNCHTMHNSQNGSPVAVDSTGAATATPNAQLTRSSCIGCHNGSLSIPNYTQPNVFDSANPTAAGYFDITGTGQPANQHNVTDVTFTNPETVLAGFTPGVGDAPLTPNGASGLDCAGATGCHGNHAPEGSDAGISGYHHGSTAYRFLTYWDSTNTQNIDTRGKPASNWEIGGANAANHNVYSAAAAGQEETDMGTISVFCGNCHGQFHGVDVAETETTDGTSWIRHPTENLVADASATPTIDYARNPMGFAPADFGGVNTNTAYSIANNPRVVCVSCHRAHGTDQPDILRFVYADMDAGGGNTWGCLGCHVSQR